MKKYKIFMLVFAGVRTVFSGVRMILAFLNRFDE